MDFDSDTQTLSIPRQGDYIYLGEVEKSDAYYIRRVYELIRVDPSDGFVVIDHLGYEQRLQKMPLKNLGHAKAWKAFSD